MSRTIELTRELVSLPSVTPDDAGCQEVIAGRLAAIGFRIERLRFGEVDNLWARRGTDAPLLVFAGHTDVVPEGPADQWSSPPFSPEIRDGYLYGRGTADMKGGLAAMVTACEQFVERNPDHAGSIAFLITSDEEGPATDGTIKVVEHLQGRGERNDYCLVGEPSSTSRLGDTIKNGRRGSLGGRLSIQGQQGHVAYPHLAENPVHRAMPALTELVSIEWDQGNEYFPPTTFQISNIHAGTGADNVIPGILEVWFNLRYSTELDVQAIKARVESVLSGYDLRYDIAWKHSGRPFLTGTGKLVEAARSAVTEIQGIVPELSTGGGTSDGRFIAPTGAEVIELGLVNATIHKANECTNIGELDRLALLYERTIEKLLS